MTDDLAAGEDPDEARIRLALAERVSRERLLHSEGVAALSAELCGRFGERVRAGKLAGLGHDVARELPAPEMRTLAAQDGRPFDQDERELPVLLHGRAGAVLLEELGLRDAGLLQAVRDHVTGRPGMARLSSIVFVADYLEPGRGFLTEERRLAVLDGGLEEMVRAVVGMTAEHLERRGKWVARASRELQLRLEQEQSYGS